MVKELFIEHGLHNSRLKLCMKFEYDAKAIDLVKTAPTNNAGGKQSFCKIGRTAKDNYFSFAKVCEHRIFFSSI